MPTSNIEPRTIPDDATPKDFTLVLYTKTEINDINTAEKDRVNTELDKKVDKQSVGSPAGLGTLDEHGKQTFAEVSYATSQEASDGILDNKTMSPALVKQEIEALRTESDTKYIEDSEKAVANGVATLDHSTKVPTEQIPTLPYVEDSEVAQPLGIATLDANGKLTAEQMPTVSSVGSYYVSTIADMLSLTNISKGDRCIVHNNQADPSKEGEYIALVNSPTHENEWGSVPPSNAVTSVNGQSGTVNITTISESAANKLLIAAVQNKADALENDIAQNTTDIDILTQQIVVNTDADVNLQNQHKFKIVSTIDDQVIPSERIYYTGTSSPTNNIGWLEVYEESFGSRIYQMFMDKNSGSRFTRSSALGDGSDWTSWSRVTQNKFNLSDYTNPNPEAGDVWRDGGTFWFKGISGTNGNYSSGVYSNDGVSGFYIKDLNTDNLVSDMHYRESQGYFINLRDKANGSLLSELQLSEDGSVVNPTFDVNTVTDKDSLAPIWLVEKGLRAKADKEYVNSAIINTYSGTTVPNDADGKDGDRYHRFASQANQTIQSGNSLEAYDQTYVEIYYDNTQPGLYSISLEPSIRKVYLDYGGDGSSKTDSLVLKLDGQDIPLTIDSKNEVNITASYSSGADSIIQALQVGTPFEVIAEIASGKEEEYTKNNDKWYLTPIFNHTYDFKKVGGTGNEITINTDTWTDVLDNQLEQRDAGIYEYKHSVTFNHSSTSRSAEFRFSLDGGLTWDTRTREVKDTTNDEDTEALFPIEYGGGTPRLRLQARCESASDTLTIKWASQILQRVA
jgi:hypothetical protein